MLISFSSQKFGSNPTTFKNFMKKTKKILRKVIVKQDNLVSTSNNYDKNIILEKISSKRTKRKIIINKRHFLNAIKPIILLY